MGILVESYGTWLLFQCLDDSSKDSDIPKNVPFAFAINNRNTGKNGLALGKGLKIIRYQDFTKKRKQSQKRKETKRNEGRVNKKRRVEDVEMEDVEKVEDVEIVEDVEKVEDFEKFVNQFNKRLRVDDV